MRKRFALLVALLLMVASSAPKVYAEDPTSEVKDDAIIARIIDSEHYHLIYNGTKAHAEEASKVLESAWPQYKEFCGREPKLKKGERLNVVVDTTHENLIERLTLLGVKSFSSGGLYRFADQTAYCYRHPTIHGAREILLHECGHQFQYLANKMDTSNQPSWFVESVAELFAMHYWDGENVTIGVMPLLDVSDKIAGGYARFQAADFSLEKMITSEVAEDYPEWRALAAWMMHGDKGKNEKLFKKMARSIEKGVSAKTAFTRNFGKFSKAQESLLAWLADNQLPWRYVFNNWETTSATSLRGTATVNSLATVKGPAQELAFTITVPEGAWRAGAVLSYSDDKNYVLGKIIDDKRFEMHTLKDGKWVVGAPAELAAAATKGQRALRVWRDEKQVKLSIDGTEIGAWQLAEGEFGVMIENSTVNFKDLKWKLVAPKEDAPKKKR